MGLIDEIIYWAEIIGTIAFALSGAMVGIDKRFDIFGIIVLAISTAVGGGAVRDVLLGRTPPNMFVQPIYAGLAVTSAIVVFCLTYEMKYFSKYRKIYFLLVEVFDTIGLGVFAVTASVVVLDMYPEANIFLTIFMGCITGVGGGILRDMMSGRVPAVLRKRIYAVAALIGSAIYYYLLKTGLEKTVSMVVAIMLVIIIRALAMHYGWNLPRASEAYFQAMENSIIEQQNWQKQNVIVNEQLEHKSEKNSNDTEKNNNRQQ